MDGSYDGEGEEERPFLALGRALDSPVGKPIVQPEARRASPPARSQGGECMPSADDEEPEELEEPDEEELAVGFVPLPALVWVTVRTATWLSKLIP